MITTFVKPNCNKVQATFLSWNGKQIERLNLSAKTGGELARARGQGTTAHITLDKSLGATNPNGIRSGAVNCTQELYDAYQKAKGLIAKSIVTEQPCPDLLSILEDAGWEVFPA